MSPLLRSLRQLDARLALVVGAGIVLGILAEASSLGLLGLSGWFIASSAIAGAHPGSTFSYVAPSAGVRSFAIARIAFRYLHRIVTHTATLRWLGRLRVRLLRDLAATTPSRYAALRTGDALDRAMADVDTLDGLIVRALTPAVLAVVVVAGAGATVASACMPAGLVLAIGAVLTVAVAATSGFGGDVEATHRGAARAHVVAAVSALPEMIALGAVDGLRAEAAKRTGIVSTTRRGLRRREARIAALTDATAGITLLGVLVAAVGAPVAADIPRVALLVLLASGVLELVAGLGSAARATTAAISAARRLEFEPESPLRAHSLDAPPDIDAAGLSTGLSLTVPAAARSS